MSCDGCSRRDLLKGLGVAIAGGMLLEACAQTGSSVPPANSSMCGANLCIDLNDSANAALTKVDGALLVDSSRDTIMVVRVSDATVIALSAICTHAGCSMDFVPASHLINCPCHGSQFDEDGQVVRGPARRALKTYAATLANNIITITL